MQNIDINDGMKEFTINNDPQRVIRWNPTDSDFCKRYFDFMDYVKTLEDRLIELMARVDKPPRNAKGTSLTKASKEERQASEQMHILGLEAADMFDKTFNAPISRAIFCGANPLSVSGDGRPLLTNVFESILPIILDSIDQAGKRADQKYSKHIRAAKKHTNGKAARRSANFAKSDVQDQPQA